MGLINLSEATFIALHSLVIVAQSHPKRVNVKVLAKRLGASQAHLAKVFQILSKNGIVNSLRGPTGGFGLNKEAKEISFLEIYEIFDGKVTFHSCPFGKDDCAFTSCIFSKSINKISLEIYNLYKKLTLSEFT